MNEGFELNTPVAFVIFNRPDCVRKSFESIRKARPKKLFIIADGPRSEHPDDKHLCEECRNIVANIDWDCEVHHNYSDVNLGCGKRPASGFSWVFSQVEEAIILEDDCVASMSFFRFCQEMLEKYRNEERVLTVSGVGFGYQSESKSDCFFSLFNNTLGWATWKRVWNMYDYYMKDYPRLKKSGVLHDLLLRKDYEDFWYGVFNPLYEQKDNSVWDGQFMFLSFLHRGLHLYPNRNMIQYIGFGEDSTHCKGEVSPDNVLFTLLGEPEEISFPVRIPNDVVEDYYIDCKMMEAEYGVPIDGKKKLVELTKNEINAMRSAENLIIYGAGKVCRELICILNNYEINRFKIAVTKLQEESFLFGNKILEIASLTAENEKSFVVIAVKSKKLVESMKNELRRLGFSNFLVLGEN